MHKSHFCWPIIIFKYIITITSRHFSLSLMRCWILTSIKCNNSRSNSNKKKSATYKHSYHTSVYHTVCMTANASFHNQQFNKRRQRILAAIITQNYTDYIIIHCLAQSNDFSFSVARYAMHTTKLLNGSTKCIHTMPYCQLTACQSTPYTTVNQAIIAPPHHGLYGLIAHSVYWL